MGIQEPGFDLHEMQMYFEQEIRAVRTISDLKLSENDYRRLGIKLKSLFAFSNSSNFADQFMLCLAVYWTFNFIYWNEKYAKFNREFIQLFENQSQYTQRHQFDMFLECFHDFGLNGYQVNKGDLLRRCEQIVARHAGVPGEEQIALFNLLSPYLLVDCNTAWNEIAAFLPKKTRHVMIYMKSSMQLAVIKELQELMLAVKQGNATLDGLLREFPDVSGLLIANCLYWHENQELKTYSI